MAKTLLIRELTEGANAALDQYKASHGMAVNTDACMAMLERFHPLQAELDELKRKYFFLRQKVKEVMDADENLALANQHYSVSHSNLALAYNERNIPQSFWPERKNTLMDILKHEEE